MKTMNKGFFSRQKIEEARVILFGENHLHDLMPFYDDVLSEIKKIDPEFNCIFFEQDIDKPLIKAHPRVKRIMQLAQSDGYKFHFVDQLGPRPEWMLGVKDLNELYLRDPSQYEQYQARVGQWLVERSSQREEVMAKKIKELLASGVCKKGIGIFGADHIVRPGPNGLTEALLMRLKRSGITVKSYYLEEPTTFLTGKSLGLAPIGVSERLEVAEQMAQKCFAPEDFQRWVVEGSHYYLNPDGENFGWTAEILTPMRKTERQ